ncbi:hypothetical protein ES703_24984 [subsurface metagenome]
MKKLKVKGGRTWSEAEVVRQAQRAVAKQEAKAKLRPGGMKVIKAIRAHIKKDSKAPLNWNEAYLKARGTAGGIRATTKEKAKKSKLGAGFWFLVLIIVVPILVVVFLILNRDMDLPPEGGFTDEDFKP